MLAQMIETPRAQWRNPAKFSFRRSYTYADILEWPEDFRAEIVNGDIFTMPTPTPKHQRILVVLCFELELFIRKNPLWTLYPAPLSVRFSPKPDNSDTTVFEPDIVVVSKDTPLGKNSVDGVPQMIIEVLSPSTTLYDKNIKFAAYENAGVKEFWLVDPEAKTVEANVLEDGEYTATCYSHGGIIPLSALPGCQIALNTIFSS